MSVRNELSQCFEQLDVKAFLNLLDKPWPHGCQSLPFTQEFPKALASALSIGTVNSEKASLLSNKQLLLARLLASHPLLHRSLLKRGITPSEKVVMRAFDYANANRKFLLAGDAALVLPRPNVLQYVLANASLTNVLVSRTVLAQDMQELELARTQEWAVPIAEQAFMQANSTRHAQHIHALFPTPYLDILMQSIPTEEMRLIPFQVDLNN